MDPWPHDHQRHKRTFDEMSQHTSLSPSPFFFGHPIPPGPLDNPPNFFERRRTSHPHNQASQSSYTSQNNMAEPRALQRPSLEHRTSQTIIDLTDDTGESSMASFSARFMPRPPLLGRSDGALDLEDIIDLTTDVIDDDVEIIDARQISEPQPAAQANSRNRQPPPRPHYHRRALRDNSPSMFVPQSQTNRRAVNLEQQRSRGLFGDDSQFNRLMGLAGTVADLLGPHGSRRMGDEHFQLVYVANQPVPHLDYDEVPPFQRQRQQKPQHQPPPAAKPGFTRSPKEDDVIICPACLNELIKDNKAEDDVVVKKSHGKAPNKKDREEHPFWVIKECGHVYCNKCYQGRRPDKRRPSNFPETTLPSGKTVPTCAVEGCNKDVGDKKHWVGIFFNGSS